MYRCTPYHVRGFPDFAKSPLSEVNTGDPLIYIKHLMDGTRQVKYHVNLIDLLDRVFTNDGMRFLSLEQERFISEFLKEAGTATNKIKANDNNPYEDMDSVFKQLDDFLGSYVGVDDGRYTR